MRVCEVSSVLNSVDVHGYAVRWEAIHFFPSLKTQYPPKSFWEL